ncbi:RTCB [Hepatospora eriocheir]|uniref:3'-phosphate/5'-hydroxy nucleic acid ligase n=1 Tax=Hepatospora eriocheir TaxID=1081669 RepID=A0A1X0QI09_9MICR|nr:RTCB [Hepatospora eriocheir]
MSFIEKIQNKHKIVSTSESLNINDNVKLYMPIENQEELIEEYLKNDNSCLKQIFDVIDSGIVDFEFIGFPDMHVGYVFPIGTLLVMKLNKAFISPHGIGNDIACGVRSIKTNIFKDNIDRSLLADKIKLSLNTPVRLTDKELRKLVIDESVSIVGLVKVNNEFKLKLEDKEGNGESVKLKNNLLTGKIIGKGISSFGTLGQGNHYAEIQYVYEIFDEKVCNDIGIKTNQIIISIHSGSRTFGKCIANLFEKGKLFVDYNSQEGEDYLQLVKYAERYAYFNREVLQMKIVEIFKEFLNLETKLLCDSPHNIVNVVEFDGKEYLIHRKGVSSFNDKFVSIGGSMATASYLVMKDSNVFYNSTCHGSGRKLSRRQARETLSHDVVINSMKDKNIELRSNSKNGIIEEAGECYKDIDQVISHCVNLKNLKRVCKFKPCIVIKE